MRRSAYTALLLLGISLSAASSAAQELFGSQPQAPYTTPDRLLAVRLPPGWQPRLFADKPDFVEFRAMDKPGTAWLQVQRQPVSEGAKPRQLLARAVEHRLRKLPHFAELSRRDVEINGLKGAVVLGTYWYQGNAQFPRAIEEVYVVLGKDAFELHFECFEPLASMLAADLNQIYSSFIPRPPSDQPLPGPDDNDDEDPLDKIPF